MSIDSPFDALGVVVHELKQKYNAPEFVKSASVSDLMPDETDENYYTCFADPLRTQLPCHTKKATWLSAASFADNIEDYPDNQKQFIANNLQKFAEYWGIVDDVNSVINNRIRRIKEASYEEEVPDDQYAINTVIDGKHIKEGLIRNPDELNKAASWLLANRDSIPLEECTKIAQRIIKRADAIGATLDENNRMEQLCGMGAHPSKDIARALTARAQITARYQKEASDKMRELALRFESGDFRPGSNEMFKVACAIDQFDQYCGLTAMRNRGDIPYPEEICYGVTSSDLRKFASENVRFQTGDIYALNDLSDLPRGEFESHLGSDLADECFNGMRLDKQAALAILPTLPRPMAQSVITFLNKKGVKPIATEKASSAISIPDYYSD